MSRRPSPAPALLALPGRPPWFCTRAPPSGTARRRSSCQSHAQSRRLGRRAAEHQPTQRTPATAARAAAPRASGSTSPRPSRPCRTRCRAPGGRRRRRRGPRRPCWARSAAGIPCALARLLVVVVVFVVGVQAVLGLVVIAGMGLAPAAPAAARKARAPGRRRRRSLVGSRGRCGRRRQPLRAQLHSTAEMGAARRRARPGDRVAIVVVQSAPPAPPPCPPAAAAPRQRCQRVLLKACRGHGGAGCRRLDDAWLAIAFAAARPPGARIGRRVSARTSYTLSRTHTRPRVHTRGYTPAPRGRRSPARPTVKQGRASGRELPCANRSRSRRSGPQAPSARCAGTRHKRHAGDAAAASSGRERSSRCRRARTCRRCQGRRPWLGADHGFHGAHQQTGRDVGRGDAASSRSPCRAARPGCRKTPGSGATTATAASR